LILQLKNIGFKRDKWVLRNVDLSIHAGSLIGIIGKSGIGKTTLLKLIAGLVDATEGEVIFEGQKIVGPETKLIPGYEDIQVVNQDFGLELYHTVEENIREKVLNLHRDDRDALVEELLDLIELKDIRNRQARYLSGGEQQRLSIARALACEPKVILLDEPFVHLDQRLRLKIENYLVKLNEIRNTTIVLVSHDGAEILGLVREVIHINDKRIQRSCGVSEMYYHPQSREQGELMGLINEVQLEGEMVLFRPNEYDVDGIDIELKFLLALDVGLMVFNYFRATGGEEVVLVSQDEMDQVQSISIKKKG
jgi:ABC-type nitrate/sulfonate/bicarbonate transport system ATPase subunit